VRHNSFVKGVLALQNEGAYKVLAKAQELERGDGPWSKSKKGVIHMEIGQPDLPTPEHIKEAGIKAIQDGKTTYTNPSGILELRESLVRHIKRTRGVDVSPDEIYVGPGCKPGIFFVAQALLQAGDELLYPDPGFPMYHALSNVNYATAVPIPLDAECRSFQWDAFDKAMASGRAKALILNSPSNPTGGVMPPQDVERVVKSCKKHGVWLISDEIYSSLVYDPEVNPFTSPLSIPGVDKDKLVVIDGFSKTYCMTGWRLGWGWMPKELAERVHLLTVHSAGCTASFTQWAGLAAIEGPQDCVREMTEEYRKRRDYVLNELNSMPGVWCPPVQGAFYAFPDVSAFGMKSTVIADMLLEEGGVAVLPGTDFGKMGEGHIRFSYVLSMEELQEGMARVRKIFADLDDQRIIAGSWSTSMSDEVPPNIVATA